VRSRSPERGAGSALDLRGGEGQLPMQTACERFATIQSGAFSRIRGIRDRTPKFLSHKRSVLAKLRTVFGL